MSLKTLPTKLGVLLACMLLTRPAPAVDTDGDGLLDLIDVVGFDPSTTGTVVFTNLGIEDLDGAALLTNAQLLSLWNNQITSIEGADFDGLNNLQTLYLFRNQITSLESGDFEGLTNLQTLRLSSNPITSIEDGAFQDLRGLRTLWLESEDLREMNFTRATFEDLSRCDDDSILGFCVDGPISTLVVDDAVLSNRSFDAIVGEMRFITDASLVGFAFSDENPSDLSRLLGIRTLDNITVDESLFDMYVDEFNAFAAMEGNMVRVVPEPSAMLLVVLRIAIIPLRRRR